MISEIIDEGTECMPSRTSPRTIGKGDDAYTETLKQFTGIHADVCKSMQDIIKQRKATAEKRVKIGDVYGEAVNGYMDAVESGQVVPDIKAQVRGENAVNVGVWFRTETAERFEKFVNGLGEGGESEVLAAALRWFIARK
jgi:hypothetical protein